MRKILFRGIVGSKAMGTATPTSDTDVCAIFRCDNDDLLGFKYKEHDDVSKDDRWYELGKFIRLLADGNPSMMEVLHLPKDCILETSPEWDIIVSHREKFVTKQMSKIFHRYIDSQFQKAKEHNKKREWEKNNMTRKHILDFCYILPSINMRENKEQTQAIPVKIWLEKHFKHQKQCGLVAIDHFRYSYIMYVENYVTLIDVENYVNPHGFSGLVADEEKSLDVCLSSIPKNVIEASDDIAKIGVLSFNKDAYSVHCRQWKEYQEKLKNRNLERHKTNLAHGQDYDSKNVMHIVRLLMTARDLAETGQFKVRRSPVEAEYLLKIKSGQENLEALVGWSRDEMTAIEKLFEQSTLPDSVDPEFCHNLVVSLRKM